MPSYDFIWFHMVLVCFVYNLIGFLHDLIWFSFDFIWFHMILCGFHINLIRFYIRHSASCEGVFSVTVAWTGLFSVLLRGLRTGFSGVPDFLGPSVFGLFFVLFSKSLF